MNEILAPTNISNNGVVLSPPHITALSNGGYALTYATAIVVHAENHRQRHQIERIPNASLTKN